MKIKPKYVWWCVLTILGSLAFFNIFSWPKDSQSAMNLLKAIDDALFTLQIGQMSPIIDSGPSFHIIRVLERKEAGRKAFTDVQADIRDRLKEKRYQKEASAEAQSQFSKAQKTHS